MTTKSHQPEFVAEIIGKTLDHLTDDRKRVAVNFELAENGCMEETHVSLKRRIATMWGFQTSGIELLEASTTWFELGGMQFNVYNSVQFSVNGKGWSTDFKTIARHRVRREGVGHAERGDRTGGVHRPQREERQVRAAV